MASSATVAPRPAARPAARCSSTGSVSVGGSLRGARRRLQLGRVDRRRLLLGGHRGARVDHGEREVGRELALGHLDADLDLVDVADDRCRPCPAGRSWPRRCRGPGRAPRGRSRSLHSDQAPSFSVRTWMAMASSATASPASQVTPTAPRPVTACGSLTTSLLAGSVGLGLGLALGLGLLGSGAVGLRGSRLLRRQRHLTHDRVDRRDRDLGLVGRLLGVLAQLVPVDRRDVPGRASSTDTSSGWRGTTGLVGATPTTSRDTTPAAGTRATTTTPSASSRWHKAM